MIFKLPYSWLKEFVDGGKDAKSVASLLSLHGPSVEKIEHVKHEFKNVIVGQINSIELHPNADKLKVAIVNIGKNKPLTIVCGAPNIAIGQKVPVALVGAVLPGGLVIEKRKVRDVESEGMLCSARELGIHDDHLGILILHPSEKIGSLITSTGSIDDYVLEVEPTTNRPDVNSVIGVARELSAIINKSLKHKKLTLLSRNGKSLLSVEVREKKKCSRFSAILVDEVTVTPSPWWMQERLSRAGIRPINIIVDITNYVLIEYGQPMHAFDADKLGLNMIIRSAKDGEKILALDGRIYSLKAGQVVVADNNRPVSVAGIMGGEETSVTEKTKRVVLEAATWDPVNIRQTSRDLQLSSDSSRLFDKGLSVESLDSALARAVDLVEKLSGGKRLGSVVDVRSKPYKQVRIKFSTNELARILGINLSRSTVVNILKRLGFGVSGAGQVMNITVPYWREYDILGSEDIIEEVARLYGYHKMTGVLPTTIINRNESSIILSREDEIKNLLKTIGFTEIYSYSFIPERWISFLGLSLSNSLKVLNPLTNDLAYMRPSLLPSLVNVISSNLGHHDSFQIFEAAKIYEHGDRQNNSLDSYRKETSRLACLLSLPDASEIDLYRQIKGVAEALLKASGVTDVVWKQDSKTSGFVEGSSSTLYVGGQIIGTVGMVSASLLSSLGVNRLVSALDFSLDALTKLKNRHSYYSVPKFPAVKRDLSLVIDSSVRYTDVVRTMKEASLILENIELFDIYQGQQISEGQCSYAFHLTYRSSEKTLSSDEVEKAQQQVVASISKKFKAIIRD